MDNILMKREGYRRHAFLLLLVGFVCAILSASYLRMRNLLGNLELYTDCNDGCYNGYLVLTNDALVLAFLLALVGMSFWGRFLKTISSIFAFLLIAAFFVDIYLYKAINYRLTLSDVFIYGGELRLNWTFLGNSLREYNNIILCVIFFLAVVLFLFLIIFVDKKFKKGFILVVISLLLISFRFLPQEDNIYASQYKDVVTSLIPSGENIPYGESFVDAYREKKSPDETCGMIDGGNRQSVILLVIESWSLYHSKLLTDLNDYTPELDDIASRYTYLSDFYANDFTTAGGLIALLAGHQPLPAINRYGSTHFFSGYENAKYDAYSKLRQAGYGILFFTTGDLGFLDKNEWLYQLGFEYIEGAENAFYDGMRRGTFNEAGDRALYARFLNWLDVEHSGKPFFAALETVTTHPPFYIPETAVQGEASAFRYADKAAAEFVRELESRGFFEEHGILVITSDHRSMTAIRKNEIEVVGADAYARVPAIIVSAQHRNVGAVAGRWQQADFLPSLLAVSGQPTCTSSFAGRFLGGAPLVEADYVLASKGAERDQILVRIKGYDQPYGVKLRGDATGWLQGFEGADQHQIVIDEINRQRILLPEYEKNFASLLLRIRGLMK